MRDAALKALLDEKWRTATALYSERLLRNPDDAIARSNRAVALYEAEQWPEAARAFAEVIVREGPFSEVAPPALFSLGYCCLELRDDRGALEMTTMFLELSNEAHPFYWDGVENIACAAGRLGEQDAAARLYRVVLGARPHAYAFNGLALALGNLGRAAEGVYVIEAARQSSHWDDVLTASLAHLKELAAGECKPTPLTAQRWSRERVLHCAFGLLGWSGKPLEASTLTWQLDVEAAPDPNDPASTRPRM